MAVSGIPQVTVPITGKGMMERTWFKFFTDIWKGLPQGSISTVSVGTSPFTYQAQQKGFMIVHGGTVTLIQFTRDGVTNINTGVTSGCIPLSMNDSIIVTYSGVPSMTWVPQ